jgi:hypothetical protein
LSTSDAPERTYTAEFASGFRAELTLSATFVQCSWFPEPPRVLRGKRRREFLTAYRAFRDASIADYARYSGLSIMVIDL